MGYSSSICALYRDYTVLAIAYLALYVNMIIREELFTIPFASDTRHVLRLLSFYIFFTH